MTRKKKNSSQTEGVKPPRFTDADIAATHDSVVAEAVARQLEKLALDSVDIDVVISDEEGQRMSKGLVLPSQLVETLIENRHRLDHSQIERVRLAMSQELINKAKREVFGKEKPSVKMLRDYLRRYAGQPLTEPEREQLTKTLQTITAEFNFHVCHRSDDGDLVPVTITTRPRSHSKGRRFNVREAGGERRTVATTQTLPQLTATRR